MLNLLRDAWIPILHADGTRSVIAPWQIADDSIAFPDWPRADLNVACLELLIGLVFMADPPRDSADWKERQQPDPARLRQSLARYEASFELMGNGPRFMQDLEPLEAADGAEPNGPDMLFLDSAGGETVRNNADLSVKRDRYPRLSFPTAAMALFTLQAHAPSGGAGNRTSMRGGGPLVTLIDPGTSLWRLVWANVPDGKPAAPGRLPWVRPCVTSNRGDMVFPNDEEGELLEAFFGMPRRLRLVGDDGGVTGMVQRPYGTNYAGWEHPLTPHYRKRAGGELLPRHPRAGPFGYRNWLGVIARRSSPDDTARRARVLDLWRQRLNREVDVLVAGWSMFKMKPRDFVFSRAPLVDLDGERLEWMEGLVEAADQFGGALWGALTPVLAEGHARDAAREDLHFRTQGAFEAALAGLQQVDAVRADIGRAWLSALHDTAFKLFDALALPGLAEREVKDQQEIVTARRGLGVSFAGYGELGRPAYLALGLEPPSPRAKKGVSP